MRKPILAVVLGFTAFAAVTNIGFKLAGAIRQVTALAGANAGSAVRAADRQGSRAAARVESIPVAPPAQSVAVEQSAPPEPYLRFDTEAALREAAYRDSNLAELLNDPDPAVGRAVQDFITSLAAPGSH